MRKLKSLARDLPSASSYVHSAILFISKLYTNSSVLSLGHQLQSEIPIEDNQSMNRLPRLNLPLSIPSIQEVFFLQDDFIQVHDSLRFLAPNAMPNRRPDPYDKSTHHSPPFPPKMPSIPCISSTTLSSSLFSFPPAPLEGFCLLHRSSFSSQGTIFSLSAPLLCNHPSTSSFTCPLSHFTSSISLGITAALAPASRKVWRIVTVSERVSASDAIPRVMYPVGSLAEVRGLLVKVLDARAS